MHAKKNELKPWLKQQWYIPPRANDEFVCQMEEVLDVYKRPYNPKKPMVCFDERPKQLISEMRKPIPSKPGKVSHYDYEYRRNGVANLFMMFEPLAGRRHAKVNNRRTKKDFAECMRQLVDEIYPQAEKIVTVMDNLNTQAWATKRNAKEAKVDWRFTTEDARIKPKKLYPSLQD